MKQKEKSSQSRPTLWACSSTEAEEGPFPQSCGFSQFLFLGQCHHHQGSGRMENRRKNRDFLPQSIMCSCSYSLSYGASPRVPCVLASTSCQLGNTEQKTVVNSLEVGLAFQCSSLAAVPCILSRCYSCFQWERQSRVCFFHLTWNQSPCQYSFLFCSSNQRLFRGCFM